MNEQLEHLKDKGKKGEEFFLIWAGKWCAGYMKTPGVVPEMDVRIEVFGNTIKETLINLSKKIRIKEFPSDPIALQWTKDKPTKPGSYWYRYPDIPAKAQLTEVWEAPGKPGLESWQPLCHGGQPIEEMAVEWYGPLSPPQ
jgi:hypothetical protein